MTDKNFPGFDFADTVTPTAQSMDVNGHVNVGYYGVFFDMAADTWLTAHGMSEEAITSGNVSLFASETHTRYYREVRPGGRMDVYFRVADLSPKALLAHLAMRDPETGELIAMLECLWLGVDLETRRVTAIPADVHARFAASKARHDAVTPDLPFKGVIAFRR